MSCKSILIDLGKLKTRYSGLGEMSYNFAINLIENLDLLSQHNIEVTLLVPPKYVGSFGNKVKYLSTNFFRRHFPFINKKYDCWYAAHQDSGYMPGHKQTKYFLTIHDLNVAYNPDKIKAAGRLKEIQQKINRADFITVNSNFTKKEVTEKLILNNKKINVVYCGSENFSLLPAKKPDAIPPNTPFFLHISTITPKKNTKALVSMMKEMPGKNLVIAGSWDTPYAKEIKQMIEEENIQNIICLNKVDNFEKAWLYQHCDALFFPSFLEGFGLPVIEAMYCGKPVFASTCTSLPEIGSDKAFYWDSFDPKLMKKIVNDNMALIANDPSFEYALKKYADTFNWTKNIRQYIHFFISLLNADTTI